MAPEHPPGLVIFDARYDDDGALKGTLSYIEVPPGKQLRVRWDVEEKPQGFLSVGDGVAYVFDSEDVVVLPISRDAAPDPLDEETYRWTEGLKFGIPWIMFVLILPEGKTLRHIQPRAARVKVFKGRIAVYWILKGDDVGHTEVTCAVQDHGGDLDAEIRRINSVYTTSGGRSQTEIEVGKDVPSVDNRVFVSYSHGDQEEINWLAKLQNYLAPFRKAGSVDLWDDTRIQTGERWRDKIEEALARAKVAVLLVGPGFFASDFIDQYELPTLLAAAQKRGVRIFPLVTGHCAYTHSLLEPFQSFNPPDRPLEALEIHEQNRTLNEFSIEVAKANEYSPERVARQVPPVAGDLTEVVKALRRECDVTGVAFRSQNGRARELVATMTGRLQIQEHLEFEKFFFRYYGRMNAEERFEFKQIRAVTEGPLQEGNRRILQYLIDHPNLLEEIPDLTGLRQHLVFWINKFEKVFLPTEEMSLCYVGVEDGVPWPQNVEGHLQAWLHKKGNS